MNALISWLNYNSGFVSACLTFVYVVATIFILTKNHQLVLEMRRSREQQIKANIVASFETRRKGLMCFVLRNMGGSVANELNINISDEFINSLDEKEGNKLRKLKSASLTIIPKQEVIFVAGVVGYFAKLTQSQLKGTITYKDVFGKSQIENFNIDIESYGESLLYGPGLDELTTIIDRGLENIASSVTSK